MTRTDIPDDLVSAIRAAAGGAPPYQGDLAAVRRRGRARRRRRVTAVVGGAALAVAVAVAVPSAISGGAAGPVAPLEAARSTAGAAIVEPAEPAQRLLLGGAGWVSVPDGDNAVLTGSAAGETARAAYERLREVPGAVGVLGGPAEVRPDGEVVDLDLAGLPGIDGIREVVAMPDGRLAVLGSLDRLPGVERQDGPCVEGVDFPLLVVEPTGSVSVSRQVRVVCEQVSLVAADEATAYLVRDAARLVAHDLATGTERTLVESAAMFQASNVSVAGDRVATVAATVGGACDSAANEPALVVRVTAFDGDTTRTYRIPNDQCRMYGGPIRLSPDGRYLAAAYVLVDDGAGGSALGVAVVDFDTGEVVDRPFVTRASGPAGMAVDQGPSWLNTSRGAIAGIAWHDQQTVRVAWHEMPEEGVHWQADLVQVATVTVP